MTTSWHVIIAPVAKKRILRIPNPDRERILAAIDELHSGLNGDIKPLSGRNEWRLRVGGWRVLLDVDIAKRLVVVLFVGSRGDIYK